MVGEGKRRKGYTGAALERGAELIIHQLLLYPEALSENPTLHQRPGRPPSFWLAILSLIYSLLADFRATQGSGSQTRGLLNHFFRSTT